MPGRARGQGGVVRMRTIPMYGQHTIEIISPSAGGGAQQATRSCVRLRGAGKAATSRAAGSGVAETNARRDLVFIDQRGTRSNALLGRRRRLLHRRRARAQLARLSCLKTLRRIAQTHMVAVRDSKQYARCRRGKK